MTTIIRFRIEAKPTDTQQLTYAVTRIKLDDLEYQFPTSLQHISYHVELNKVKVVQTAIKAINKLGQYRTVNVKLDSTLKEIYFDEEDNPIFKDNLLETYETTDLNTLTHSSTSENVNYDQTNMQALTKLVECLEMKLKDNNRKQLKEIVKEMDVDKFDGKNNPEDFIDKFETECVNKNLTDDEKKIKALKYLLKEIAIDWYSAVHIKNGDKDWNLWKKSFLSVFGFKNWQVIRYAYAYKYQSGKLIDYALKKQRLLLEIEPKMTDMSMIHMIAIGLPISIQDKLKKDEITTAAILLEEITKLDTPRNIPNNYLKKDATDNNQNKQKKVIKKEECSICVKLNKPGRFHPKEKCWFNSNNNEIKINKIEEESDEYSDEGTQQKN